MIGKFYSVGIGMGGDYLTLAAKRTLEEADVIAVPAKENASVAAELIKGAVDIDGKDIITLDYPMSRDINARKQSRLVAADKAARILDSGKTIAMITLGDNSIYSTCSYIAKELKMRGYETKSVAGVPAFCAAAACAGVSLCEGNETLAVVPAVNIDDNLGSILDTFDNIVIMKAGKNMRKIYDMLEQRGLTDNAVVTSRVGMDGEYIGKARREEFGYFTMVIINKNQKNK